MSKKDWAIIIGINAYPTFLNGEGQPNNLRGAVNDAVEFCEVINGLYGVPDDQILLMQSETQVGLPTRREVLQAINFIVGHWQAQTGNKRQDRLYVFMAGHGFQVKADNQNRRVLLMADAQNEDMHHVLVEDIADIFDQLHVFREILLFADCCANRLAGEIARPLPIEHSSDTVQRETKIVKGYSSQPGYESHEALHKDQTRFKGLFSTILIKWLRDNRNLPDAQTSFELCNYMYQTHLHIPVLQAAFDTNVPYVGASAEPGPGGPFPI